MESDHVIVDFIVLRSKQFGPQTTVDTRTLVHTALATGMPEEGAMCDSRLLRRDTRVPLIRIPGVKMRVQVNHRDGPIDTFQRAQDWKHDGMIAAQTDDAGVRPFGRRVRRVVEDLPVPLFHLLERVGSIKWCDGDIAAVYDAQPFFEWIHAPDGVVAAALFLAR